MKLNEEILAQQPTKYWVRKVGNNLQTENLLMCCVVRLSYTLSGDDK
jgi:hypothetical protein